MFASLHEHTTSHSLRSSRYTGSTAFSPEDGRTETIPSEKTMHSAHFTCTHMHCHSLDL